MVQVDWYLLLNLIRIQSGGIQVMSGQSSLGCQVSIPRKLLVKCWKVIKSQLANVARGRSEAILRLKLRR
jgi:hypothetical protein